MDEANRRRGQQHSSAQHGSQRYSLQDPAQGRPDPNAGRYRQSMPSSSTPRGMGYSGYYSEQTASFTTPGLPASGLPYSQAYGDSRQTQGFGNYNANSMVYNPTSATPVYDTQFDQRQPGSLSIITPDIGTAYFGADGTASAASLQASAQSANQANVYQSPNIGYSSNHLPTPHPLGQPSAAADSSMNDAQDLSADALEEKWISYQQQLASIFRDIAAGSLDSASETLLSISTWLLSQVMDLGLHLDDSSLFNDRIKLWNDFNHAWLGLGFKQREMMASGQVLSRSQSLMSEERIIKMGDELIRLCDDIERHGLVDYQYGVWEEQIEELLEDCLDLYETADGAGAN